MKKSHVPLIVALLLVLCMILPVTAMASEPSYPERFIIIGNRMIDFDYWQHNITQSERDDLVYNIMTQLTAEGWAEIPAYWRLMPGAPLEDLRNYPATITEQQAQAVIADVIVIIPQQSLAVTAARLAGADQLRVYFSEDIAGNSSIDLGYFAGKVKAGDTVIPVSAVTKAGKVATLTLDTTLFEASLTGRLTVAGVEANATIVSDAAGLFAALDDESVQNVYLTPGSYNGVAVPPGNYTLFSSIERNPMEVDALDATGIAVALSVPEINIVYVPSGEHFLPATTITAGKTVRAAQVSADVLFAPDQEGVELVSAGSGIRLFAPAVLAENFNTHSSVDYKGVNVGFKLDDLKASQIKSITVELFAGATRIAANSAKMDMIRSLGDQVVQHSTPFIIHNNDYAEAYWNLDDDYDGAKPTKAVITVVDVADRVYIVENTSLNEDTVAFAKLLVSYEAEAALSTAKAAAALLVPADYVDYSAVTSALALPETTEVEVTAKAAAINNAISALVRKTYSNYTLGSTAPATAYAGQVNEFTVSAVGDGTGNTSYTAIYRYEITGGAYKLEYKDGDTWTELTGGYFGPSTGFELTPTWNATTNVRFTALEEATYQMNLTLETMDGKVLATESHAITVATVTGSIAWDPGFTGGSDLDVDVDASSNTITFNGEIDWYPADETLGRAAGNRVGVEIIPPAGFNASAAEVTIGTNKYTIGTERFFWYPLVTWPGQGFTARVKWNSVCTQTFAITIMNDATLAPAVIERSADSVTQDPGFTGGSEIDYAFDPETKTLTISNGQVPYVEAAGGFPPSSGNWVGVAIKAPAGFSGDIAGLTIDGQAYGSPFLSADEQARGELWYYFKATTTDATHTVEINWSSAFVPEIITVKTQGLTLETYSNYTLGSTAPAAAYAGQAEEFTVSAVGDGTGNTSYTAIYRYEITGGAYKLEYKDGDIWRELTGGYFSPSTGFELTPTWNATTNVRFTALEEATYQMSLVLETMDGKVLATESHQIAVATANGTIAWDPGFTGGSDLNVDVDANSNTITFNGEIDWYPADEALGRAAGNRVGVEIIPPAGFDASAAEVTIGTTKYTIGAERFFWYPLVTWPGQGFTATVKWNSVCTQIFTVTIMNDATLAPAVIERSAGSVTQDPGLTGGSEIDYTFNPETNTLTISGGQVPYVEADGFPPTSGNWVGVAIKAPAGFSGDIAGLTIDGQAYVSPFLSADEQARGELWYYFKATTADATHTVEIDWSSAFVPETIIVKTQGLTLETYSNYTLGSTAPATAYAGQVKEFTVSAVGDGTGNTSYTAIYRYEITGGAYKLEYKDGDTWTELTGGYFGPSTGFELTPTWNATTNVRFTALEEATYQMNLTLETMDGKVLATESHAITVATVTGSIAWDPGFTGGSDLDVDVDASSNTITFAGEIDWYPADETLGRAAGNRVGVEIIPPAGFDASAAEVTIGTNKYTIGTERFFWYPLVTWPGQGFTATVKWNSVCSQTFAITIMNDATLAPAVIERSANSVTQDPGFTGGSEIDYTFNPETNTLTISNGQVPYVEADGFPPTSGNWVGVAIKAPAGFSGDIAGLTIDGQAYGSPFLSADEQARGELWYYFKATTTDATHTVEINWSSAFVPEIITVKTQGLTLETYSNYTLGSTAPAAAYAGQAEEFTVSAVGDGTGNTSYTAIYRYEIVGGAYKLEYKDGDTWRELTGGYFGPSTGFELTPTWNATTSVRFTALEEANYEITLTLETIDGKVLATKSHEIAVATATGTIAWDPGFTGGSDLNVDVDANSNTITFNGEIDWYPADEALGRAAGNRVGVEIIPPAGFDASAAEVTIGTNKYTIGAERFFWYPLVTLPGQEFTARVKWNSVSTQVFTVKIANDATLAPAVIERSADSVTQDPGFTGGSEIDYAFDPETKTLTISNGEVPYVEAAAGFPPSNGNWVGVAIKAPAGFSGDIKSLRIDDKTCTGTILSEQEQARGELWYYFLATTAADTHTLVIDWSAAFVAETITVKTSNLTLGARSLVRADGDVTQDGGYTGGTLEYTFVAANKTLTIDADGAILPYYAVSGSTPPRGANWVGVAIKVPAGVDTSDVTATINGVACANLYFADGKYMEYIDVKATGNTAYSWVIHWGADYADETISINLQNVLALQAPVLRNADSVTQDPGSTGGSLSYSFDADTKTLTISNGEVPYVEAAAGFPPSNGNWVGVAIKAPARFSGDIKSLRIDDKTCTGTILSEQEQARGELWYYFLATTAADTHTLVIDWSDAFVPETITVQTSNLTLGARSLVRADGDVTQDGGCTGGTLEYDFVAANKTLTIDAGGAILPYYAVSGSTPPRGANWVGVAIKVPAGVDTSEVTATINNVACSDLYFADGKYMEYIDVKATGNTAYSWVIHWGADYADETISINLVNVAALQTPVNRTVGSVTQDPGSTGGNLSYSFDADTKTLTISGGEVPYVEAAAGFPPSNGNWVGVAIKAPTGFSGDIKSLEIDGTKYNQPILSGDEQARGELWYYFLATTAADTHTLAIDWSDAFVAETITVKTQGLTLQTVHTVTFKDYDGTVLKTETVVYGTAATAPADPSRIGYTFAGWDAAFGTVTGELTVTATYNINRYTITFASAGGTDVAAITQDYGTTVTAPADPTRTGYTFAGWNPVVPATMPASSLTLTAQWTINQYTITFAGAGGTAVDAITQDYGAVVTAPVDPIRTGYTFAGWSQTVPATMPAENLTLTAQWNINNYAVEIAVQPNEGGSVTGADTYTYGTSVTVTATANTGYDFVNWTEDGTEVSADTSYTFTAEQDRDLIANFRQRTYSGYTITIDGPAYTPVGTVAEFEVTTEGNNTGNTGYTATYDYAVTGETGTLEYNDNGTWRSLPLSGQFGPAAGFVLTPSFSATTELRFTPTANAEYAVTITLKTMEAETLSTSTAKLTSIASNSARITVGTSVLEGQKTYQVTVHGVNVPGASTWTLQELSRAKQAFGNTFTRGTTESTMLLYVFDSAGLVIGQYTIAYRDYANESVTLAPYTIPAACITVGLSELEGQHSYQTIVHGTNIPGAASWTIEDLSRPKQDFGGTFTRGADGEMPLFIFDDAGLLIGQYSIEARNYNQEIVALDTDTDPAACITVTKSEVEGTGQKTFTVTVHGANLPDAASWTLLDVSKAKQAFGETWSRGTSGGMMPLFIFDDAGLLIGQYDIAFQDYIEEIVPLSTAVAPAASITVGVSEVEGKNTFMVTVHGTNMPDAASWTLLDQSREKKAFEATYTRGTDADTMLLFVFDAAGEVIGQYTIRYQNYLNEVVPLTPVVGERYTITFQVTDGTAALAGAQVAVSGQEAAITDGNGVITFSLPAGSYTYTVSKASYQSVSSSVEVVDAAKTVQVSLALLHQVTFTVTDGTNPIAGAQIAVGSGTLVTNAQGVASTSLPAGSHQYTVTATGYANGSGTAEVLSADLAVGVSLSLPTYTVTFTVYEGEAPLSWATVTVEGNLRVANAEGTVTFDLANGTYRYSVVKSGYDGTFGSFTVSGADKSISVTLVDEDVVEHQVNFTVTGAGGAAVSGATVNINSSQLTTDSNGHAQTLLVNGYYNFTVTALGYRDYLTGSVMVNNDDAEPSVALTLAEYRVTFTVTREDTEAAIEGAEVQIGEVTKTTSTSGEATFDLTNGSYTYTISKTGFLSYTRTFTVVNAGKAINIELVDQDAIPHTVTFTVTDGTNSIAGATVNILGQTATTNSSGVATFSLVNGSYPYTVTAADHISASGEVTVDGDNATESVSLTPLYAVSFEVQVTDGSNPIAGATVVIGEESETTDAEGKASFALASGKYSYTVSKLGYDTKNEEFTVDGAPVSLSVQLTETEYAVTFTITGDSLAISGAAVTIGSTTVTTDENGEAQFDLVHGTYSYQVSAAGFITQTGSITVPYDDLAEQVDLARPTATITVDTAGTLGATEYTVTVHSTNLPDYCDWTICDESWPKKTLGESLIVATAEDSMPLLIFNESGQVIATYQITEECTGETVVLTLN